MTFLFGSDDDIEFAGIVSPPSPPLAEVLAMFPRCVKCGEVIPTPADDTVVLLHSPSYRAAHGDCSACSWTARC
jgi:hypothetical protein